MKAPRKAFLLAAGLGTRLRPLSLDVPKPMLPLAGEPLIGRIVDMLAGWGVREFLVNLHHCPQPLFIYLRDRAIEEGLQIEFSYEPEILGTGGALRRADWFLDDAPFWIVNTDIAAVVRPEPFLRAMARGRAIAALWVTARRGPRTVELDDGSRVRSFRSGRPGTPGTVTFCGLHLVSPRILSYLPEAAFCSIVSAYEAATADGHTVLAVDPLDAAWDDMGTPDRYLAAQREFVRRLPVPASQRRTARALRHSGVHISNRVSLPFDLRAGRGASIADAAILPGVRLAPGTTVHNAIVGPDVALAGTVTGLVVRADRAGEVGVLPPLLKRLDWPIESTAVQVLPARGSDRRFLRLMWGTRRAMAVIYGDQRPENRRYAGHAWFLRRLGVDVPRLLADAPDLRSVVFEDAGDATLETCYRALSPARRLGCYHRVLAMALRMHTVKAAAAARLALEPAFTRDLYRWEHELFDTHLLARHTRLDTPERRAILEELAGVAERLATAPHGIVHRDLQSSNVMLKGRRCVLIDFQGMRWGPVAYDLASLLCDPYVMLAADTQERLLGFYCDRHPRGDAVLASFWPAAVQRLTQALGAYGRLSAIVGMERFAGYIPPALRLLRRATAHAGETPRLQALAAQVLDNRA